MPSVSLTLGAGVVLAATSALAGSTPAYSYTLQDTYGGGVTDFYDNFNFITDADPTHGFVQYVDESTASSGGFLGYGSSGSAKWGVDNTTIYSNTSLGRPSVRLEGKTNYNHGLFIADIKHMPGTICGTWPAFWTLGDATWPAHGEIDIIEGVNLQSTNQMTAHTAPNCTVSFSGQSAYAYSTDCSLATGGSTGCESIGGAYGTNFNTNGGGVWVMQWTSSFIKLWFFARGSIPASITAGNPDYTTFGTPMANFDGSSCNIDSHFINHRIVFDTTFCGDWAGSVYSSSSCPLASSGLSGCVNYVANNPSAFNESYWEVNSIKVYAESTSSSTSSSASSSATSSSTTSSSTPSIFSTSTTSSFSTYTSGPPIVTSSSASSVVTTSTSSSTTSSTVSATPSTTSKASSTTSSVISTTKTTSSTSSSTLNTSKSSTSTFKSSTSSAKSTTSSTSTFRTSTYSTKPSTSILNASDPSTNTSKTASSTTSSTLKTSTTSTTLKTSTTSTTLKTSTTSSSKTTSSTTTSTSATPTVTAATCPTNSGKIYVTNNKRFLIECGIDHNAGNLKSVNAASFQACIQTCATTTGCVDVSFTGGTCYMKSSLGAASSNSGVSGGKLLT